jgi:predicted NUDIX family NTP pyrophosphohydrolase
MAKKSAGILLFQRVSSGLEVMLVHPGGPFWAKKDEGAWSIPKGEFEEGEEPLQTARREFEEETGRAIKGEFLPLAPVRQAGGKVVHAWAVESDFDISTLKSNTFSMEWPPRSGRHQEFPEADRACWFSLAEARRRILKGHEPLLGELERKLGAQKVNTGIPTKPIDK